MNIDELCRDVLAASEGITPLPWICDSRCGSAGIYPAPKQNCFHEIERFIIYAEPALDEQNEKDWQFAVAACNAAPALARECQRLQADCDRLLAALREQVRHCGDCGGYGVIHGPICKLPTESFAISWPCKTCKPARDLIAEHEAKP